MNYMLICVIGLLAVCGYAGYKKGIISITLSIVAMVMTILATVLIAPLFAKIIKENTSVYDDLYVTVESTITNSAIFKEAVTDTVGEEALEVEEIEQPQEITELQEYVAQVAQMINLPEGITGKLQDVVDSEYIQNLQSAGTVTVKNMIASVITERMTYVIFNTVIHIIIFIVIYIVLRIIFSITNVIGKLPVIRQANQILGLAAGIVEGVFFVWIAFSLLTAFGSMEWAALALTDINDNSFLSFLYNNNLILKSIFTKL